MLSYQANNVPLLACNESKPDRNDPRMKSYVPEQNALKHFSKVITHGKLETGNNKYVMIRKQPGMRELQPDTTTIQVNNVPLQPVNESKPDCNDLRTLCSISAKGRECGSTNASIFPVPLPVCGSLHRNDEKQ